MELEGKVAIVTGAGTGIGRATALRLGREGAHVLAAGLDAAANASTARDIVAAGGSAVEHCFDLADIGAGEDLIQAALRAFDRVDVLANVAAIYPSAPIDETDDALWSRVLAVDLTGPFTCCRAALRCMRAQGSGGAIVNVASGAAFTPMQGFAAYAAAKGGLVSLSRVIALEARGCGVRVNLVVPGHVATPGAGAQAAAELEAAADAPPSERWLRADEVADVIAWCASDAARSVSGAILRVDGGRNIL
jgi:NAD(P)-dependent dehydrogenase (short-subunit alcohol dehydrogenase family)